jgi:hypothetical protein
MWSDLRGNFSFYPSGNVYNDDYLIKDFTLSQIKMLRRKNRYSNRNQYLNGIFDMLTFDESIEMILNLNENFPKSDR